MITSHEMIAQVKTLLTLCPCLDVQDSEKSSDLQKDALLGTFDCCMIGRARGRKAVPDNVELRAKRGLPPSVPFINVPELRRDITRIKGLDNTRSPVRHAASVQVSGATGTAAATINGVYRPVAGEGVGGKPVYKKDGADVCIEYWPGREQWQMKPGSDTGRDSACMHSLGYQKEAGVVEDVTAGWNVYDSTTKVWSEQAGVRVVRHAAAVQVSGA